MPPTRSTNLWNILIKKYINVHLNDNKPITRETAAADLTELYQEIHQCLYPYQKDSVIIEKINTLIDEYHRDIRNKRRRENARATLSMS